MEQPSLDQLYMSRCLELASNGMGNVAPNPMVGSVIVHNNKIIAEGYHTEYGKDHAERAAINAVKDTDVLSESTLYVSLEPCSHFGKTPPCANLIIDSKIKRVVVATLDPNPKVQGRGIELLKNAGVEVKVGVLEKEAKELNRRFFVYHIKKRPYVILKWAQTLDGYIDAVRKPSDPIAPVWVTNELSRTLVHRWRSEEQAIMIGTNTVDKDNPRLDVRDWSGRSPMRIVLDRKLRLSPDVNVYDGSLPTIVFVGNNSSAASKRQTFASVPNIELLTIDFAKGAEDQVLKELYDRGINSVIVEGGAMLINSFVKKNYWDEARVFVGNKFFGDGVKAPELSGELFSYDEVGDSKLFTYRNRLSRG
ncbi:bifunctional diaminohydroxyphosphoribosylaminopyrimidine deaminase/5-amino-6-(5-phosphoribosylamino)uracil reductase RibD [Perlabentimonas gracilis]|uniref:bifunctional diaminohydroxyphosphoribosylaminopyrimidine deaminase/5-amino-6-(5-phosphoribosylamino)uracil reductase RibD n=1 Tax=Perlabentimonas gracilis TaxID=2715279 RepID=UPI001C63AB3D|nr:bifunctional diaminohydroxyphosphoribosylaminopyrimidine deaminase/5-amino-6-(5-phosphoribosylamino)uracil reductase RibD [Perlabentimonas gracilis]